MNSVKDIFAMLKICDGAITDLPTSVNSRVSSSFHEGFIFVKLKFHKNITLTNISEFTVVRI